MPEQVPSVTQSIEMTTPASANAPNLGQVTAIQRPDYVPEKFYDSKTGVIDFEAMAKSYGELERSRSAAPKETPAPPVDGQTSAPKPEAVAPPVAETPTVPGVTPERMKLYTDELTNVGTLSDASYAALLKDGYSKGAVDSYVKGLMSDARASESVSAARVADATINEITDSIGGKAVLADMQKWAVASLSDKQLAAYNAGVSSGDPEVVRLSVQGLHHSFTKANGTGENLLSGSNPNQSVDMFESRAELTAAINNPLYTKDSAYRARVQAKIGRSQI